VCRLTPVSECVDSVQKCPSVNMCQLTLVSKCRARAQRARNGKGANKYCDAHIPEGIAAGHIKSKRQKVQSEAASSSVTSMPDDWKLLAIERIFDSRCATSVPPPRRSSRPCPTLMHCPRAAPGAASSTVRTPSTRRMGWSDLGGGDARERRVLEYLVLGHFERKEGDSKGTHTMLWLALVYFDNSAVFNEVVDAKLDGWELQGALIRKEARRLQRQGAANT